MTPGLAIFIVVGLAVSLTLVSLLCAALEPYIIRCVVKARALTVRIYGFVLTPLASAIAALVGLYGRTMARLGAYGSPVDTAIWAILGALLLAIMLIIEYDFMLGRAGAATGADTTAIGSGEVLGKLVGAWAIVSLLILAFMTFEGVDLFVKPRWRRVVVVLGCIGMALVVIAVLVLVMLSTEASFGTQDPWMTVLFWSTCTLAGLVTVVLGGFVILAFCTLLWAGLVGILSLALRLPHWGLSVQHQLVDGGLGFIPEAVAMSAALGHWLLRRGRRRKQPV